MATVGYGDFEWDDDKAASNVVKHGVTFEEYWVVDPSARALERLVLQDGKYLVADVLAEDATFRPESFEGMEIPLAALWQLPGAD